MSTALPRQLPPQLRLQRLALMLSLAQLALLRLTLPLMGQVPVRKVLLLALRLAERPQAWVRDQSQAVGLQLEYLWQWQPNDDSSVRR